MILQAFLRGAIVIMLAALIATLLRHRSAAMRHHVWATAMVVQLAIVAFIPVLPTIYLPVIPAIRAQLDAPLLEVSTASQSDRRTPAEPSARVAELGAQSPAGTPLTPTKRARTVTEYLFFVWIFGGVVILGRFIIGTLLMTRIAVTGERVEDGDWLVLAQRTARELGITRPVTMIWGDQVAVPITWGVLYPMILLPRSAREWSVERRRFVLVHEMAHVKRFDAFTQLLAQVTTAVLWFSPFVWLAERRMRIEREHACDDTVIQHGTEPSRYADELLQMVRTLVRRRTPQPAFAALAMARQSEFEGRMLAILDPERPRRVTGITSGVVFAMLSVLIAAPLAAVNPFAFRVTTTSEIQSHAVAPITAMPPSRKDEVPVSQALPMTVARDTETVQLTDVQLIDKILTGITSSHDLTNAMLSQVGKVNRATLVVFARHAARMTSDYDLRTYLTLAGPYYMRNDPELVATWFKSAAQIESSYERRVALTWALSHVKDDTAGTIALLHATRTMSSGFDKAVVLTEVARQKLLTTPELRTAFLAEVSTLSAGSDRRTVLEAL